MKTGRFINWQKTRVIQMQVGVGEGSPYWSWLYKRQGTDQDAPDSGTVELHEPSRANPDVLAAPDEDEIEPITRNAMFETIRDVKLSKNERLTLQAFMQADATEENVAAKLGCTRRAVRIYLHRAQKKCEKLFVAKMRRLGV